MQRDEDNTMGADSPADGRVNDVDAMGSLSEDHQTFRRVWVQESRLLTWHRKTAVPFDATEAGSRPLSIFIDPPCGPGMDRTAHRRSLNIESTSDMVCSRTHCQKLEGHQNGTEG
ncbi:hypothetical protein DPEC_G00196080 [Dallia pectoralis]|uniref:Uncharacterized protein n=1 Tax=Dallia pectoralis TaxID=75939 RepID=A0ACC2G7K0_DALPE|nr:hypothetical protein DPEC_G00196080 [Dallia pectoralis]